MIWVIASKIIACVRSIKYCLSPKPPCIEYEMIKQDPLKMASEYLEDIQQYSLSNVPYYKLNYTNLVKFPPLTKDVIRASFTELTSKRIADLNYKENTSGGSTGIPVKFLQDSEYDQFVGYALKYWYNEILGYDLGELRKLMIWGSEKDLLQWNGDWKKRLSGIFTQTRYVNAFSLSERDLKRCVKLINSYRPEMIRGYANSLVEVANYIEKNHTKIYKPLFIVSSAETLTDEMRSKIKSVFGCPIYDLYGSRECGALAGECREGNLHIFSFNHHVEVVNSQGVEVNPGEMGTVLVTTLHNHAMPLLRFEIGDFAVKGPAQCKCGNPLPTLQRISGRISNSFIKADGTIIHGEFFTHLFYNRNWLRQFQVVQEKYDEIKIYISLNPDSALPDQDRQEINTHIRKVMGSECRIEYFFVEVIPKSPQGKFLFTYSKVPR